MNTTISMHNVAKIAGVDRPLRDSVLGEWLCREVVITDSDGNAVTIYCHMARTEDGEDTSGEADAADALAGYQHTTEKLS